MKNLAARSGRETLRCRSELVNLLDRITCGKGETSLHTDGPPGGGDFERLVFGQALHSLPVVDCAAWFSAVKPVLPAFVAVD